MMLKTRAKTLDLSRPLLMGVLNVTPDSFSDGGKFLTPEAAIARAEELIESGADVLDVGGESTRPGAAAVSLDEELSRVLPVVETLCQRFPETPVSLDTTKAEVARRGLDLGVSLVNDVSALRFDKDMAAVVREHGVPVILMHMRGDPRTMQSRPAYDDVVAEIKSFFRERISAALSSGLKEDNLLLDPGIGFGKTLEHNLEILRRFGELNEFGRPLVVGVSLKSFIGALSEGAPPAEREAGTIAASLWAAQAGARLLRVHDVKAMRQALAVWDAIARPGAR
jgi:dihydropteroate synthase